MANARFSIPTYGQLIQPKINKLNLRAANSLRDLLTQRKIYKPNSWTKNPTKDLLSKRGIYKTKAKIYQSSARSTKPTQDLRKNLKRNIYKINAISTKPGQYLQT